ncbi:hypothetical protein BBJ28_00011111 [Nothophytophthora sp. Chile5]|nr:hypothetical protein BBJ28_00011111 [Nothophytophthora sp. Chile5]
MSSSPRSSSRSSSSRRVTLGPQLLLKKNTFQGLVIPVAPSQQQQRIDAIITEELAKQPRLRKFQEFPRASRLRTAVRNDNNGGATELVEQCEDDGLPGVGDRLLYLLQRWQVTGLVLVVAHRDASLSGRLLGGAELFKLSTEAAKLALEQHYVDSVAEAAKVSAAAAELEQQGQAATKQSQQVVPAVCIMSSDTVPTWPRHHQPTSDGGGRRGVKQGRINHFRHRELVAADPSQQEEQVEESSSGGGCGGLEWLGVSREEWRKLRGIRVPVRELHYLFMCLVVLLEPPAEQRGDGRRAKPTPKQQEQFVPTDFSWVRCRHVLHKSTEWSPRLRVLRGSSLAASQAAALRAIFQEPTFTESAFVRIAGGAGAKLFTWLQRLLDEYDEMDLGLLRIDVEADAASPLPALESPEEDQNGEEGLDPQEEKEPRDQKGAETSSELLSADKWPRSPPGRKPLKIVDPGRLFGRHHSTQ